jgi:single-strand DNA-binding protein
MASLNRVYLMGRLTRDPELRYTPKGTAVTELGVAVSRVWTDDQGRKQEEPTFVEVTLWAKQAEVAQQYLQRGSTAFFEGRLQLDVWEESGQKRSKLRVVGERLQLLDPKPRQSLESAPSQGMQAAHSRRPPPDPHLSIPEEPR